MPDPEHAHTAKADAPSDAQVLAAVERAARHHPRDILAVPAWAILGHLGIRQRSPGAREVRSRLEALCAQGSLARTRRHGVPVWELTDLGRRGMRRARASGEQRLLPESPQHRAWQVARTSAAQEIERFRAELGTRLAHAEMLLDAQEPPPSDAWLEIAEQLGWACRRLASASYCMREWREPDDARADIDERLGPHDERLAPRERARRRARRGGRRNIGLWDERR